MGRASVNQTELVVAVCRHIERADAEPTLEELASLAGVSSFYLQKLFKAQTGVTPKAYAQAQRARRVREALASQEASVTAAFYDAGYSSSGRFYEQADAVLGMTPRAFKSGGTGHDIRFAVGQCTLGAVLVAASERGVCAILLGDEPELLVKDLQDRFKTAHLIGADQHFEQWVAQVVGFIESPHLGLNLPLDIRGTAFQQRVWQALRRVPAGQTVSYSELAERIGAPRAVRAVAGACAANPLAVAIPCHRVVRHDGATSGYRWGVERKRNLLCREAAERDKVIG